MLFFSLFCAPQQRCERTVRYETYQAPAQQSSCSCCDDTVRNEGYGGYFSPPWEEAAFSRNPFFQFHEKEFETPRYTRFPYLRRTAPTERIYQQARFRPTVRVEPATYLLRPSTESVSYTCEDYSPCEEQVDPFQPFSASSAYTLRAESTLTYQSTSPTSSQSTTPTSSQSTIPTPPPTMPPVGPSPFLKLYALLGLTASATPQEIKSAYRKLARKHHPDKNPGNAEAAEHFKKLTAAHTILSDEKAKAIYDLYGEFAAEHPEEYEDKEGGYRPKMMGQHALRMNGNENPEGYVPRREEGHAYQEAGYGPGGHSHQHQHQHQGHGHQQHHGHQGHGGTGQQYSQYFRPGDFGSKPEDFLGIGNPEPGPEMAWHDPRGDPFVGIGRMPGLFGAFGGRNVEQVKRELRGGGGGGGFGGRGGIGQGGQGGYGGPPREGGVFGGPPGGGRGGGGGNGWGGPHWGNDGFNGQFY